MMLRFSCEPNIRAFELDPNFKRTCTLDWLYGISSSQTYNFQFVTQSLNTTCNGPLYKITQRDWLFVGKINIG